MKRLLLDFLWSWLSGLGAFEESGRTPDAARESAGLAPGYEAWFDECLRVFEAEGYLTRDDGKITVGGEPRPRPLDELWREWDATAPRWRANPDLAATLALVETTMRVFPDLLTGRRTATEVMFPGGSMKLVEDAYTTNPASAFFHRVLADDLVARLRLHAGAGNALRILEIGAGTGATSAVVLEAVRSAGLAVEEYCYTDVSRAFLHHAEQAFGPSNPFLAYGILDVEHPIAEQGVPLGGHDAVIAANVLHATRDIRTTVRNAKAALKPGGLLFLNELTANNLLSQFSFGLLEGWWRYTDPRLRVPGSPLLSAASWRRVLTDEGFRAIDFPAHEAEDLGQQIIVAASDGVIRQAAAKPRPSGPASEALQTHEIPARAVPEPRSSGTAPGDRLLAHVEAVVLAILADALKIPRSRFKREESFSNYGLDSIFAVNVARAVGKELGVDLDITVLFEHNTLADLGEFIVEEYADELRGAEPVGPTPAASGADVSGAAEHEDFEGRENTEDMDGMDGMAIIGMSARFPRADDVEQFWRLVERGERCITAPPVSRPDWARHGQEAAGLWGGFLDGAYDFDPLFFRMSVTEARQVSPEVRLMLMAAWNAVEDAGYQPSELRTRSTGVFVATAQSEYRPGGSDLLSLPTTAMVPNRISYLLDLTGPSEQYDTACSSSFVALHRAIRSIRDGECEQAIVGGVNLVASPAGFGGMQAAGMLSARGEVRPFQQDADGTARSEGVAAIVIKPLRRAVEDGDFVHGVVRGTGVAHGGRGVSLTAPNIRGMKAAVARAYADAGIEPGSMDYVETHGMSSLLADGAELAALSAGLRGGRDGGNNGDGGQVTHLGNLKPVIGHAEVASGLAALVKTVSAMRHGVVPAVPGFGRLHRDLSLEGTGLRFATRNMPWPERTDEAGRTVPRRAGLHSFGIGGVNAHVVLEHRDVPVSGDDDAGPQVLVLSAQSPEALRERAGRVVGALAEAGSRQWADIAYTLQVGREAMRCRLAFVASTPDEAAAVLGRWLDDDPEAVGRVAFTEDADAMSLNEAEETSQGPDLLVQRWVAGASVDWRSHHTGRRRRVPLPGYPFARQTCFAAELPEPAPRPAPAQRGPAAAHDSGEDFVADLFVGVLGVPREEIDGTKSLADYGLNSLLTVAMLGRIRGAFPAFQPDWLQPQDTLDAVVARLSGLGTVAQTGPTSAGRPVFPELVHLNTVTEGRPVFWIHGALASVESYRGLAGRIGRPFHGIQARGFLSEDAPIQGIAAIAGYYAEIVRSVQPEGPYDVGGFCLGGIVAYEVAGLLQAEGHEVGSLTMIDSPDNTGLAKSNANGFQSAQSAALQVVNSLLWPAGVKDSATLYASLIHQDEVADVVDEDAFVTRLADLAAGRGLGMRPEQIGRFIRRNMAIQLAYGLGEYEIRPLPRPQDVTCTYFRNRRGLYLGDLEPYFQVAGETFSLDHVDYRQDWEREMPGLRLVDIDAANHMTILHDEGPLAAIEQVCADLYAADAAATADPANAADPVQVNGSRRTTR